MERFGSPPTRSGGGTTTRLVEAVATAVLHDRRPIAVTGSDDHTVLICDLTAGAPIGKPLTGHTDTVLAAATVVMRPRWPVHRSGRQERRTVGPRGYRGS